MSVETYWGVSVLARVLDSEHGVVGWTLVVTQTVPSVGQVVDDRVVDEVRGQLQQQCLRAEGGGRGPGCLDGHAVPLGEGKERLDGFFGDQRQVDVFSGERASDRRG